MEREMRNGLKAVTTAVAMIYGGIEAFGGPVRNCFVHKLLWPKSWSFLE